MTIRSLDVPELDTASVSAGFERRVREVCPDHLPMATRLLARLPPERWMLEWHLPWWLGHALGLDRGLAREIVLSNLLGLGSIRLQDDLADGEVAAKDMVATNTLSAALYEAALEPYRSRFPPESEFWAHLETCMAEWRSATGEGAASGGSGAASGDVASDSIGASGDPEAAVGRRLEARGAPLKISAFAICLSTGRIDLYPTVDRCLDDTLEALVLYDHLADWEADLDAGRWNAFIADLSDGRQVPAERARHRRAVFVALMTTDAVAVQVGRIEAGLLRAADLVTTLGVPVPPLVRHLRGFAQQVGEQGREMQAHYRDLGDRAARLLLDPPVNARS